MSFRNRLALFFVLIVIVPMLAVTFLLFRLIAQSENGKSDAAFSAQNDVAQLMFVKERDRSQRVLERTVAKDAVFTAALQNGERRRAAKRARQLVKFRGINAIVLVRDGRVVLRAGHHDAIAPGSRRILSSTRRELGRLEVSVVGAQAYAADVRRITGLHTVIRDRRRVVASTLPALGARALPADGKTISVDGREYRVVSFTDPSPFTDQHLRVSTLRAVGATGTKIRDGRITAVSILLGFFLIAIACAVLVSRTLQQQIAAFLKAARALASGDFSAEVPTVGHDEFAELGDEFNKMSRELERRLAELQRERERMQDSMRRLGEAVASGLDGDRLLELVVRTAVDGAGADTGRARVRAPDGLTEERSRVGTMNGLQSVVETVEDEALRDGNPRERSNDNVSVLAHPLSAAGGGAVVGVVSIGRAGKPFTDADRELLRYLADQAARSIENVQRHETAWRESLTDNLTGLPNHRAFDNVMRSQVERNKRYGDAFGLVLVDLDNFKSINDTYLHETGDRVLREVGRVLRETSREIDLPARIGGEELAIVVPGTDLEGTFNLAERVRERIAALRIESANGKGLISVTASIGVAAAPPTAADERLLKDAADIALYDAKHTGKNKTVRAR